MFGPMVSKRRDGKTTASMFAEQPPAVPEALEATAPAARESGDDARASQAIDALLAGLNPAQREAATHADGPLLILAGAGSGKTRAITRRIAWLIRAKHVHPSEILAITFTNKAAGEMRERVEQLGVERGAWIATFHAMCARILRRDIEHLGGWTRDFTIYDTDDRNKLLRDLIKAAGYDTTQYKPGEIGSWISTRKNRGRRAGGGDDAGMGMGDEVFTRVERDYAAAMLQNNALDFDDLLLKVIELFDQHRGVRDLYAQRFRYVMVDEYQDTNRVQYELLRHLASFHHNIAVCGDPDQSIYGWRGADIRNILDFERDFPGAKVVRLEQNYRSTQTILDAASALIRNNRKRKDKALWSDKGAGDKLAVIECGDEDDEAREIALRIRNLADTGRAHSEFAVFYRVNFMQRAIERALRLSSIPYQIVAGTEFYQRREIKDLIAYLRLLCNPADNEACRRALGVPSRGIGEKSLDDLASWAADRRVSLLRACASEEARSRIRGRARAALQAFAELIEQLSALSKGPASDAMLTVIARIDYMKWIEQNAEREDVDRAANVEELVTHATRYDAQSPEGGLRGFLQDVALVSDADGLDQHQPKVALMTMHAAKGLEFPVVFIAGLEEGLLPHARSIGDGWESVDRAGIEEERRLCFVGITRAQESLTLTHARVRRHFGQEKYAEPSRFLAELPDELVDGARGDADGGDVLGDYIAETVREDVPALRVGDTVEHDHFGRGCVEILQGRGVNARATVRFERHGSKQLMLQYARLRKVGGAR
jgi:DNA helicase-2/ATP-dependent DNA helicase PcrA